MGNLPKNPAEALEALQSIQDEVAEMVTDIETDYESFDVAEFEERVDLSVRKINDLLNHVLQVDALGLTIAEYQAFRGRFVRYEVEDVRDMISQVVAAIELRKEDA